MNTPNVYVRKIPWSEHYNTTLEWITIRTCPKCGRQNDVTRKYCTRCGALLLKLEENVEPEPIETPEEVPVAETRTEIEEDTHVLPSQVASEQAEYEMPPTPFGGSVRHEEETTESQPMDNDRGKAVVADILEKVRAAEARSRGEETTTSAEPDIEPPPSEPLEIEEPTPSEEFMAEPEVEEPEIEEPVEVPEPPKEEFIEPEAPPASPPPAKPVERPAVVKAPVETMAAPAKDEKVRMFESDISAYNIELKQLQSELGSLHTRLDEEVERYRTAAEVKRTRTESLERELSLAKKEYNEANKEYKNSDNRRKKEISTAEKRIREAEKRIKKAEDGKRKRLSDLEKERRKREQAALKG